MGHGAKNGTGKTDTVTGEAPNGRVRAGRKMAI